MQLFDVTRGGSYLFLPISQHKQIIMRTLILPGFASEQMPNQPKAGGDMGF